MTEPQSGTEEHSRRGLETTKGRVSESDFAKLANFIEGCGFYTWSDRYETDVTDNPEYELETIRGSETKKVVQYATDEPGDFWTIATLVDGICFGVEWTRKHKGQRTWRGATEFSA